MCAGFPRYILKSIKFDKQGKGQDMCSLYLCFNLIYNVYNVFWACSDLKFDHNRTLKDLSYDGIFHMYTHLNCIFCAEAFKRSSIKKKYYRYYLSMKNFELYISNLEIRKLFLVLRLFFYSLYIFLIKHFSGNNNSDYAKRYR